MFGPQPSPLTVNTGGSIPAVTHLTAEDRENPRLRVSQPPPAGEAAEPGLEHRSPISKSTPCHCPPVPCLLESKVDSKLHIMSRGPQRAKSPGTHENVRKRTGVSVTPPAPPAPESAGPGKAREAGGLFQLSPSVLPLTPQGHPHTDTVPHLLLPTHQVLLGSRLLLPQAEGAGCQPILNGYQSSIVNGTVACE